MLTFRRISFVLSILVLPLLLIAQPGINTPGLHISVPTPVISGGTVSVTYSVYHNFASNVSFTLSANCSQCTPGTGTCPPIVAPPSTQTSCTVVYDVNNVPDNFPINFTGSVLFLNPVTLSFQTYTASAVNVNALPVEIISFRGFKRGNSINLTWQTATELNNEAFMVEKSTDGSKFSTIGKVDGAGTTFETQNYTFRRCKSG
jgi:hypothetical protein